MLLTIIRPMLIVQLAQLLIVFVQPRILRQCVAALRRRLEYQTEFLQLHNNGAARSRTIDEIVMDPVDDI